MQDSNQPTQLQRLARMLKFCVDQVTFLGANDKTMRMCRLVCASDVRFSLDTLHK